ncbi:MAG: hypothetical protein HN368_03420, partial [Spirochaetales bacterium]|nr:hypothetical protein [Spirochaetales bacterium]
MNTWNVNEILAAMRQGGEIALSYYESPSARLKSDMSLVTEADHAIEHAFEELFDIPEEGSYLIGEETIHKKDNRYVEKALEEVAWIIDPIDGTAPYAHHIPTWGISIARMEGGVITDGAIYLPVTGEMYITSGSEILAGTHPCDSFEELELKPIKIVRRKPDVGGMVALTQTVVKRGTFTLDNPVQALACAVLPMAYLLTGRFLGYTGTVKLWDIAGALAMLTRAEFTCKLMNGTVVGTAVSPEVYHLDEDSPYRWFLRDRII